jgi:hypothetical protein
MHTRPTTYGAVLALVGMFFASAHAEPYIAVESGLKCNSCHTNPSGGGKRTAFGAAYAYTQIAARQVAFGDHEGLWNGEVNRWLALGANLRTGYDYADIPGSESFSDAGVSRGTAYLELRAVPGLLSFYVDQQLAPDDSTNREAYMLLTPAAGKYTLKVGQMFLPFGLRLQDDTSFVRQASGINFNTPDDGIEAGLELEKWSVQLAVSEGAAGGPDTDSGEQMSLSAALVRPTWRIGASYNRNDSDPGDREMQSIFAGLKTGPIAWLAEVDFITDESPGGNRDRYASLLEGNWRFRKGHNFKLSYEFLDPDDRSGEDELERYSIVWEFSPLQYLQSRIGVRAYNGVPGNPASNRDEAFAELHAFF